MENQKKIYANQWNESSNYIYNNKLYLWMSNEIKKYNRILEIGCGTGQSTLALIEEGHKIIAVEKNQFCIEKAKSLIKSKGYIIGEKCGNLCNCDVIFIDSDIMDNNFYKHIEKLEFDIVICWNVGSYWDKEMLEYYVPYMLEYGLTIQQIQENYESSYGELIQWKSCGIAKENNVPINIVDRAIQETNYNNDDYYVSLLKEFNFSKIKYKSKKTKLISNGGRLLSVNGKICTKNIVDAFLLSITIK